MKKNKKILKTIFLTLILSNGFVVTNLFSMDEGKKGKRKRCQLVSDSSQKVLDFFSSIFKRSKKEDLKTFSTVQDIPREIIFNIADYLNSKDFYSLARSHQFFYRCYLGSSLGEISLKSRIKDLLSKKNEEYTRGLFLNVCSEFCINKDIFCSRILEFLLREEAILELLGKAAKKDCKDEVKCVFKKLFWKVCNGYKNDSSKKSLLKSFLKIECFLDLLGLECIEEVFSDIHIYDDMIEFAIELFGNSKFLDSLSLKSPDLISEVFLFFCNARLLEPIKKFLERKKIVQLLSLKYIGDKSLNCTPIIKALYWMCSDNCYPEINFNFFKELLKIKQISLYLKKTEKIEYLLSSAKHSKNKGIECILKELLVQRQAEEQQQDVDAMEIE